MITRIYKFEETSYSYIKEQNTKNNNKRRVWVLKIRPINLLGKNKITDPGANETTNPKIIE